MRIDEFRKRRKQDPKYVAVEKELKPYFILGNNILRLRMEKRWSQSKLAKIVDTKQTNISKIENGLSNPTYKFLIKVAEAFNISIAELVQEESTGTVSEVLLTKGHSVPNYLPGSLKVPLPEEYKDVAVESLLGNSCY